MPIATEIPAASLSEKTEESKIGDDLSESGLGARQSTSQERQGDSQYAPISSLPALGQVCR